MINNENKEDQQSCIEMYKSDEIDLLSILKDIENKNLLSASKMLSSMDTALRESVQDYICDYLCLE